jgi:hypothetical protein
MRHRPGGTAVHHRWRAGIVLTEIARRFSSSMPGAAYSANPTDHFGRGAARPCGNRRLVVRRARNRHDPAALRDSRPRSNIPESVAMGVRHVDDRLGPGLPLGHEIPVPQAVPATGRPPGRHEADSTAPPDTRVPRAGRPAMAATISARCARAAKWAANFRRRQFSKC